MHCGFGIITNRDKIVSSITIAYIVMYAINFGIYFDSLYVIVDMIILYNCYLTEILDILVFQVRKVFILIV